MLNIIKQDDLYPGWTSLRRYPSDPDEEALLGPMKGWKAFDKDLTCSPVAWRSQRYAVGETYRVEGDISMCTWGMHFCDRRLADVYVYYEMKALTRICEVSVPPEARVIRQGTKCVTDTLVVVRELTMTEILDQLRTEMTGFFCYPDLVYQYLQIDFLENGDKRPRDCPDWEEKRKQIEKEVYGDSLHQPKS